MRRNPADDDIAGELNCAKSMMQSRPQLPNLLRKITAAVRRIDYSFAADAGYIGRPTTQDTFSSDEVSTDACTKLGG